MIDMFRICKYGVVAAFFVLLSCTSPRYVPKIEDVPNGTYGAAIELRRHSKNTLIQGELLEMDRVNTVLLTEIDKQLKVVEIPTPDIKMFKLRYAKQKQYGWSIPVYALAGVSHGWFGVFTIPINLIITGSVTAAGANAFTYNNKQVTIDELRKFARFPQGIPPNISHEMLETTVYEGISQFVPADSTNYNGGFEIVEDGVPVNWFLYNVTNYEGIKNIQLDNQNPFEGKNALAFTAPSSLSNDEMPAITQFISVEPETNYNILIHTLNKGLVLELKAGNPANNFGTVHSVQTEENSDAWQSYSLAFKTEKDQNKLRIEISSITNGTALIDGVELIKTE